MPKLDSEWLWLKDDEGRLNIDICITTLQRRIEGATLGKAAETKLYIEKHRIKNINKEQKALERLIEIKHEKESNKKTNSNPTD